MIFQQAPGWWIIRTKGWAECSFPSFSMDGGWKRRSLHHPLLLLCCARFSIWGANVKRSAPGQSNDGFPLLAASLVSKEHSGWERVREGGEDVWGQKPHVEWEAAKWSLYSSSSGPVVLEGWLLQANAKKLQARQHICAAGFPLWHGAYKPSSKLRHASQAQREK